MKFIIKVCMLLMLNSAYAAKYILTVKRIDGNWYETTDGKYLIRTKYCYEYGYAEDIILKYEKYAYDNYIFFIDSGEKCDLDSIYVKL